MNNTEKIKFYFHPSPNPMKVALYLEEAQIPYDLIPVDTRKGEQHTAAFKAINPNAKTPAIVDGDVAIFDSTAILLYLAEKTGKFTTPNKLADHGRLYSWMLFIASGIGPYSGQAVHFTRHATEKIEYAINRYRFEAWRHWEILETQLTKTQYMLGDQYTIVDMSVWGWCRAIPFVLGDDAWGKLPAVKRLFDEINDRPAAKAADALSKKHSFKTEMDESARKAMFPHLSEAVR